MFFQDTERKQLERQMRDAGRLPPGQSLTLKWPVLQYGAVPRFDAAKWDFTIGGLVEKAVRLTWEEFNRLPQKVVVADMHCVTRWSRFDIRWEGVAATDLLGLVKVRPEARYALIRAEHDYTANLPLDDLTRPTSLFALRHDGEPLTAEHGYPLRLVVPHLYAWKSVKWVRGIELLAKDEPGFWEQNGYNMYGDPWKEKRFSDS